MSRLVSLLAVFGFFLCDSSYGHTYGHMEKLMEHLFNGTYNKYFRPLLNQSDVIEVNFTHILMSVKHFDIQTGELITLSAFILSWYDEMLTWETSDYGNIRIISVPKSRIWQPKIALAHGYSNKDVYIDDSDISPAWVTNEGFVRIYPGGNYNAKCKIDTTFYPLDEHECEFLFIIGKYQTFELNMNIPSGNIDMSGFVENVEWFVESKKCVAFPADYSDFFVPAIRSTLILNRRPVFQLTMYFTPISFLWFLILMSSFVPPSCGERLSYVVTVYLAFEFLFLALDEHIPKNSLKLPLYAYENIIVNFMSVLGILYNIYILCLVDSSRGEIWSPNALKKLALKDKKRRAQLNEEKRCNKNAVAIEDNRNEAFAEESPDKIESDELNNLTGIDIAKTSDRLYFRFNMIYFIIFITANTVALLIGPMKM